MLPLFLLPETVARQDGMGAEMPFERKMVRLTLGITRVITQESLEVSVWGSADGHHWRRLAAFPQKFYCGAYSLLLDMTGHPDVRYLRAQWKMGRWTRDSNHDERAPLFGFYVQAEDGRMRRGAGVA
jgi:hypothetical protein